MPGDSCVCPRRRFALRVPALEEKTKITPICPFHTASATYILVAMEPRGAQHRESHTVAIGMYWKGFSRDPWSGGPGW